MRWNVLFVYAGVTKLRFTGGEPTVRRDLVDVIAAADSLRKDGLRTIALTSNGVALRRQLVRLAVCLFVRLFVCAFVRLCVCCFFLRKDGLRSISLTSNGLAWRCDDNW
jgi:uncharacterized radical SAM superfamily Fe-S cluster-containing enzyme